MHMCILPECKSMYHMCAWSCWRLEKEYQILGAGILFFSSFRILPFTLRPLIHVQLIFCYWIRDK